MTAAASSPAVDAPDAVDAVDAAARIDAVVVRSGVERPRRADARRNFDALLIAAREAFAEVGSTASLEDVAKRAGVGIGTLYRNFPTRDDLIEAVYVDEVEAMVVAARESLDAAPWDGFVQWLHRYLAYVGTKKALVEGLNRDPGSSDVFAQCRTAIFAAGEPLLERAQADGSARADVEIEEVVRLVSGIAGVSFPDAASRAKVVSLAVDALRPR